MAPDSRLNPESLDAGRFAGAVLTGGHSSRMGSDKATLEIDGVTLAEGAARALEAAGADPVVFVGRSTRDIATRRRVVDDGFPGEGPLGAVVWALSSIDARLLAVVACDMPALHPDEIVALKAAIGNADVALTMADGVEQPLHAVWHEQALPTLRAAFDGGERSLRRVVRQLDVVRVPASDSARIVDVDTPEDLRLYLSRR